MNEVIYFINYFFLKNLSVNSFVYLHLETNSSRMLSIGWGSAFMIASFSVKHSSHFLIPPVYGWALQAIDDLRSQFMLLFFNSQINFENSLLFSFF